MLSEFFDSGARIDALRSGPSGALEATPAHEVLAHKEEVIAVITDPAQVLKILLHLVKTGKPPLGPTCLR